MKTLANKQEKSSAEGTISPSVARQAAAIFLAEGATPAWMRDAAGESGCPEMLGAVADAMDALAAEDITPAAARANGNVHPVGNSRPAPRTRRTAAAARARKAPGGAA